MENEEHPTYRELELLTEKLLEPTKTNIFLLPFITQFLNIKFSSTLVNVFIDTEGTKEAKPDYPVIYILLTVDYQRFEGQLSFPMPFSFEEIEQDLEKSSLFVNSEYIHNGNFALFTMKIPTRYIPDYHSFIRGEYSKFSTMAVDAVAAEFSNEFSLDVREIFTKGIKWRYYWENRTKVMLDKEAEVFPIITPENETFYYDEFLPIFNSKKMLFTPDMGEFNNEKQDDRKQDPKRLRKGLSANDIFSKKSFKGNASE